MPPAVMNGYIVRKAWYCHASQLAYVITICWSNKTVIEPVPFFPRLLREEQPISLTQLHHPAFGLLL